jgi:hypothetical protein
MISHDYLKSILHYDPETGVFTHKTVRSPKAFPGARAGRINTNGHRQIGIDGHRYMAHRLAWFYVYASWPDKQIDHINGSRDDNRILNLRLASHKQNMENQTLHSNNNSGHRGVSWHKVNRKWVAYFNHNKRRLYLGSFISVDEAVAVVKAARDQSFTHNKTEYAA